MKGASDGLPPFSVGSRSGVTMTELMDEFGYTQVRLAEIDGMSQQFVSYHLQKLKLEDLFTTRVWEVIGNPADGESLEKRLSLEARLEQLEGHQPVEVEVPAVES